MGRKKRREHNEPVVEVDRASKSFGGDAVVSDVSLSIRPGEVLGIVGPNGGGKSTLLLLLAGLSRPTSGTVSVCGRTAHRLALDSAGLVGLVTARPGLYPLLTGRENLRHFGGLFGLAGDDVDARAAPILQALALDEGMDRRVAQWSTGMQQKLSLTRALLLEPRLLLFDEPTANLDPMASRALYDELRRRADGGLACMLVTHDLDAAESICERVLLLNGTVRQEVAFSERSAPSEGPLMAAWQQEIGAR